MAEITNLIKSVSAVESVTSSTYVEVTNYTIAYSDLTTAGFAAGDNVIILVKSAVGGDSSAQVFHSIIGFGTTYAGRTDIADSERVIEPKVTAINQMHESVWTDKRELVVDENIYFSLHDPDATRVARQQDFVCIILNLDDLDANDWLYDDQTHSGDAPAAYDTSGASGTTGASGDWWFIAHCRWKVDNDTSNFITAIQVDSVDYSETSLEPEDTDERWNVATTAYRSGLAASVTARARYKVETATTHDALRTAIFGLRLDAFQDHDGAHTTNTVTLDTEDQFEEFAGFATFSASQTGDTMIWAQAITEATASVRRSYGRIQVDGTNWPSGFTDRASYRDNDNDDKITVHLCNVGSVTSGTRDIDMDVADDGLPFPAYQCDNQIAVVISMELTTAGVAPVIAETDSVTVGEAINPNLIIMPQVEE